MRVEITIHDVVLRGVPRGQADAVITALARHLRTGHVAKPSRQAVANAETLGARTANEVWRAIRSAAR